MARNRQLNRETVLLLAISLGQSAIYAVLRIIERMTRPEPLAKQTTTMNTSTTPDRPWLDLAYQLAAVGFGIVPALLAVHLVRTRLVPSIGADRAMGFAPRRFGFDLAWGFILFAGIGIPGLGLYLGARALGINTTIAAANLTDVWWTIPVLVALAAMNGIVEEVVMVGYLFTRWIQAGWSVWLIWVTSALIRGTYHLYQGFGGFIGNVIMGLILGGFWLRTRRVWPLVVCHTLLDVASFVGYSLLKGHVSWL
ncbi:CPBP family intramembrane glutamic endopeptidase [Aestuariimicrobium ganziense]|uniref:CPBP family intramembrane glutamic endopeptidase n=1 Tax=Aestuariimicrobium ganziense TaxID=2773677 RepID=UPI001F3D88E7|nr:type II CAAX endopeptidase family protein [Aestuariimicrobium ganziense]